MKEWSEFRLWCDGRRTQDELFQWKKDRLLPALDECDVERFLVLDEPKFVLVRVDAGDTVVERLENVLRRSLAPLFRELTAQPWSPHDDARKLYATVGK